MAESAALLVDEVLPEQPVRQWVLSFPFQLRFLFASRPEVMGRVLGIVYRAIETRLIQRFGSALNLNIHFHMLFLDGVYAIDTESLVFRPVSPLSPKVLESLVQMISQRVGCYLEHQGWLARNIENSYLQLEAPDDSAINDLLGHSITYRIAVGPQAGRKAFTLKTVPARQDNDDNSQVAKANGFSQHAVVAPKAPQRHKLERLCWYIVCPALSTERLALTSQGNIRQTLLFSFQKVLAPEVIQIGVDAFLTAQLCDRTLAGQAIQHDVDLLLRGELAAGVTAYILDRLFGV